MGQKIVLMTCSVCGYTGMMHYMGTQKGFDDIDDFDMYECPNCGADHTIKELLPAKTED